MLKRFMLVTLAFASIPSFASAFHPHHQARGQVLVPMQFQSLPVQTFRSQSLMVQSVPVQGLAVQALPVQSLSFQSLPVQGLNVQALPVQGLTVQGLTLQTQGASSDQLSAEALGLLQSQLLERLIGALIGSGSGGGNNRGGIGGASSAEVANAVNAKLDSRLSTIESELDRSRKRQNLILAELEVLRKKKGDEQPPRAEALQKKIKKLEKKAPQKTSTGSTKSEAKQRDGSTATPRPSSGALPRPKSTSDRYTAIDSNLNEIVRIRSEIQKLREESPEEKTPANLVKSER